MKVVNVAGIRLDDPRMDIVCIVNPRLEPLPAAPGDVLADGMPLLLTR